MDPKNIRILILETLQTHLEHDGFQVNSANSGEKALEVFQKEPHHIVLTDINMPGMDGIMLLEEIKALRGDAIVIMLTGHSSLTKILLSRANGATDYILKPLTTFSEIDKALHRAIEQLDRWDKIIEETKNVKLNLKP
jgi:DNA-binding NtrC family response regulator